MMPCADTIDQLYLMMISSTMVGLGEGASPRGHDMLAEVLGRSHCLISPRSRLLLNKQRNLNLSFAVAEFLWIASGRNDLEMIGFYNNAIKKFSDDGRTLYGAYGKRLRSQLLEIEEKLMSDRDSRQAVATIFEPIDLSTSTKDVPCTVSLQFLIRDNHLHLITHMRSNDIYLGTPYDIFSFTMIQEWMSVRLGTKLGHYYHLTGSLHAYKQDETKLKDIQEHLKKKTEQDRSEEKVLSSLFEMCEMKEDH